MRPVAYSQYFLPPRPGAGPRSGPRVSSWKMNAEEAAAIGALHAVPGTMEIREIPESHLEMLRATMHYQSAGSDGVHPPP